MDSSEKTVLSARNARWLALSLGGLYFVLMAAGLTLFVITQSTIGGVSLSIAFIEAAVLSVWAVVGSLIVSRHPGHPIGWFWCILPILVALDNIAWGYAYYGTITYPGSLPGVEIAIVWLYTLLGRQTIGPLVFTLLFLLFPTGRPPTSRWKILVWIAVGSVVVNIPVTALAPNPIGYFPFPLNLFALSAAVRTVLELLRTVTSAILPLCILAAIFSLFIRLARSRGVERQQLKWFVYSTLFVGLGFLLTVLGGNNQTSGLGRTFLFGISLMLLGLMSVSVASAIAIFRYRLWDIDIIIRRTLVYGLLTSILALIYYASVLLLQQIVQTFSEQGSPLVIVMSTLTTAALFSPLRRRIQGFIDRRFYRRKYNADEIMAIINSSLREEVDIQQLSERLAAVVEQALQPESLTLWLKDQGNKIYTRQLISEISINP